MKREALKWSTALAIYFKEMGSDAPQPSQGLSFLANMPCPNWHLYNCNGYLATIKWHGAVTFNGPKHRGHGPVVFNVPQHRGVNR